MIGDASFFITGTDTDVGKTYVCRLLADTMAAWTRVSYMKPVQTGCVPGPGGQLTSPDLAYVMSGKARRVLDDDHHAPYRFPAACSPHLAAKMASAAISMDTIAGRFNELRLQHRGALLVEGAGGLLVPLNDEADIADLILRLDIPTILVATPYLGTLNHTFLSVNLIRQRGMRLAGVVVSHCRSHDGDDVIRRDNVATIARRVSPVPVLEAGFGALPSRESEEFCHALVS
jgi:dethiobiotin synthase